MLFSLLLRTDDGEMVHAPLCDMAAASPIIFKMLSQVTGISTFPNASRLCCRPSRVGALLGPLLTYAECP